MPKSSVPKIADLTEREARVIPLALQWDRVKNSEDLQAIDEHIQACYAAECPYMAQRAERKRREFQKCLKMTMK